METGNEASERIVAAIRLIERQTQASGFASAEAWQKLERALLTLNGHSLPHSVARRLDRVLGD